MRALGWWTLLVLGCNATAGPPFAGGGDGGASADAAPSSDGSPSGAGASVRCVNAVCADPASPVCCLELTLAPPFLIGRCAASAPACGGNSAFACDDVTDCPMGQRCCAQQLSIGGMARVFAGCAASCGGGQEEVCDRSGPGRCGAGGFCCIGPGDQLGVCRASASMCPRDAGR